MRNEFNTSVGNLKEDMRSIGPNAGIILRWILEKQALRVSTGFS
jgi:hypothetical protein